jgi:hypothetical protein
MAFVNEMISKEDFEKYDLETINNRLPYGSPNDHWTIDRERGIWFRKYYTSVDRENSGAELYTVWDFYWEGSLISVKTEYIKKISPFESNKEYYAHILLLDIKIPKEIEQYKQKIFKDLEKVFEASNGGGGIYSRADSYKVDLEYKGELI